MVAPSATGYRWTSLMQEIENSAKSLSEPYATVDELVSRLDNLSRLLRRVDQQPSPAMQVAVNFPMEALIAGELLRNDDLNVKIAVGCCISEVARITAPEPPYEDNKMSEVSDLLMTVLKNLSSVTGNVYTKAALALDNMAKCHLFMAMWDCDDAYIIEMFREFLHHQTKHSDFVISSMEMIMTLTMKEDDSPTELFTILLNTLRRENANVSPVSYNLAERVFHNCADELKHRLPREVRLSDIALDNYSEIVTRVLNGVANLGVKTDFTGEVGPSACEPSSLAIDACPSRTDDIIKNGIPTETLQCHDLPQASAGTNSPCHDRDAKVVHGLESESLSTQKIDEAFKGATPVEISSVCAPIGQENVSGAPHQAQSQDSAAAKILQEELNAAAVPAITHQNLNLKSIKDDGSVKLLKACDQMKQLNASDESYSLSKQSNAAKTVFEDALKISPEIRKDESSLTSSQCCDETRQIKDSDAKGNVGTVNPDISVQLSPERGTVSTSRKRGRKPNSLIKPEEGYDNSWVQSEMKAPGVPRRRRNRRKELGDPSKHSDRKISSSTSGLAIETAHEVQNQRFPNRKRSRKGNARKAGNKSNKTGGLELTSVSARDEVMTPVEMEHDKSTHTVEATVRHGCSQDPEEREGSPVQMVFKKRRTGRTTSEKIKERSKRKRLAYLRTPGASTPDIDQGSKPEGKRNHTLLVDEVSALMQSSKENGKTLVGRKIKVFWPLDEMFYKGYVTSFDAESKKHKVIYDDGDEEVLDLLEEQWKLLGDDILSDSLQGPGCFDNAVTDMSKSAASPSQPSSRIHNYGPKILPAPSNLQPRSKRSKKAASSSQPSTKKRKVRATDLENPTIMSLPCPEGQGGSHSKSSQVLEGDKVHTEPIKPSPSSSVRVGSGGRGTIDYHGYEVKSSSAPVLDAIFTKYGDIAANCLYKSKSVRASLLEVVCNVVHRLKNCAITASDVKAMISEISDAADAKIDVSWLQQYLVDIAHEEQAAKTTSEMRVKGCLALGAAKKDYEQSQAELVAAQMNLKEAETRVEALKHVLERIDSGILESVAEEKSWQKRLDELLTSE